MSYIKTILYIFISILFTNNLALADIKVTGDGEIKNKPNLATFTINIDTSAKTAIEAAQLNAKQTEKTIELLKSILTKDKAVTTQGYNIYPRYEYNNKTKKSELTGFEASNTINIKSSDLDNIGDLLDKTIASGVNKINNLQFSYDKPEQAYQEALEKAVANAKLRAKVIAEASNISIKDIKDITIISTNSYVPVVPVARFAMAEAGKVSTPIETPDVSSFASVEVVFKTS